MLPRVVLPNDDTHRRESRAAFNCSNRSCRESVAQTVTFPMEYRKDLGLNTDLGSGRQGRRPAGESPAVSVARFRHVAIPRFMTGNRMFIAWCKRPGRPVDIEPQRWVQPGGLASMGA